MKLLCRLGIHDYIDEGKFTYCKRPNCVSVWYHPGTGYWDLDICDTQWVYHEIKIN